MPALQVRDMPQDLYGELKDFAKANNRSIAQQTVVILREYLSAQKSAETSAPDSGSFKLPERKKPSAVNTHLLGVLAEIEARAPKIDMQDLPSPEDVIREGRDSRYGLGTEDDSWQ